MKKIFILPAFVLFCFILGCSSTKQISQSGGSESNLEISAGSLAENLRYLASDELAGRATGTPGIEKAANFIVERFKEYGIRPYFKTYRDSFEVKGKTGYNLIGYKPGIDPQLKEQVLLIGAHYDHVGVSLKGGEDVIYNGANDNATGTAAVLELMKYLSDKDLKRSLLFVFFSAEEMGLVGAKKLANRLHDENVDLYVMLNIEMIGVPMEDRDYRAYITGYQRSNLAEKFNSYAGQQVLGYLPEAKKFELFKRSDNYPFFEEFGIPAQTISTFDFNNYDYYHHVEDEFQYMNVPHMEALIKSIVPGIIEMANTPKKEIKLTKE